MELHSNGEIISGAKRNIHGAEMATAAKPTYRKINKMQLSYKLNIGVKQCLVNIQQQPHGDDKLHNVLVLYNSRNRIIYMR